jgi:hypothetical protein
LGRIIEGRFPNNLRVSLLFVLADSFRTSPNPFIALMVGGFAVGTFGYLYGSRLIVGIGVAMVFLATLILPLALTVSN